MSRDPAAGSYERGGRRPVLSTIFRNIGRIAEMTRCNTPYVAIMPTPMFNVVPTDASLFEFVRIKSDDAGYRRD
jgi:hypothetical protein